MKYRIKQHCPNIVSISRPFSIIPMHNFRQKLKQKIGLYVLPLMSAFLIASPHAIAATPQTITSFSPATPIIYSTGKTFTVTATGGGSGNPVTFASTTTAICTVAGSNVSVLSIGTCKLTANQAGNASFSAAPQVIANVLISIGSQTISFAALTGKTMGTAPFAVSATASSGLAVAFTSTTTPVCTVNGSTVTLVSLSTCTIAANQAGNTNFTAATQVTQSFAVTKGSQTISFAALTGKTMGTAPFAVSATASSGLAVAFTSTTTPVCTVSGSTVTLVSLGTCTIAANQAGNTNFTAATQVTQSFAVTGSTLIAQAITGFSPATPIIFSTGQTFVLSAIGGASGNALIFGSTTASVCVVTGNMVTVLAVGTCSLTANQSGNTTYSAAPQVGANVVVNKGTQTISFGTLANQRIGAAPYPISATASSSLAVNFSSSTASVCTVTGSTATLVAIGTCTIAANQAGNTNFTAALQVKQSFLVGQSAIDMTLGRTHACALTNISGVKCWGSNSSGQLGDGTTTNRRSPVDVTGLTSGITAIAVGDTHTCAITVGGGVKCWGRNSEGQLGDGTTNASSVPRDVIGLSSNVIAITLGSQHSCALLGNGGIQCWGANYAGELGDGSMTGHMAPADVIGLNGRAIDIRAGTQHTCALIIDGGVQCWGYNSEGELGNNMRAASPVPSNVTGLASGIIAIDVAVEHSCALTSAGGVKCWGGNQSGSLGDGTTKNSLIPVDVVGLATGVSAIALGGSSSCALTTGGTEKCWGAVNSALTPQAINGLTSNVVKIAVGTTPYGGADSFYCYITSTGAMLCWGGNGSGQLGDGTTVQRTVPTYVSGLTGGNAVNQTITFNTLPNKVLGDPPFSVSAVASSGLAVSFYSLTPGVCTVSGAVVTLVTSSGFCTIAADQAGNGSYNAAEQVTQSFSIGASGPQTITGFKPPSIIPYSAAGTFVLSATGGVSGAPVTFGSSTSSVCTVSGNLATIISTGTCTLTASQAGNSNFTPAINAYANVEINPPTPTTVPVLITPHLSNAVLGQAYSDSLIVSAAPTLTGVSVSGLPVGMTATHNGQGSIALSGVPTVAGSFMLTVSATNVNGTSNFPVTLQVGNKANGLSAGAAHTCAVVNGGVLCWGRNIEGQLGNNSNVASVYPVAAIAAGSNATAVATGASHSCAMINGGVQCWGSNGTGQLGNNNTTPSLTPVVAIAAGSNVTALAAGGLFDTSYAGQTCVVIGGGVQCWGSNESGQLGNNSTLSSLIPVIAIAAGSGTTAVATGAHHTCAVVNGGVQCWGKNDRGQLGNNTLVSSAIPVIAIAPGSKVTAVSAGLNFTCAVVDGGVQCWGDNAKAQLLNDNNFPFYKAIPTLVRAPKSGVTAIASGDAHTCAVISGGAQCWGFSGDLQLGSGSSNTWYSGNDQLITTAIGSNNNVSNVAAGGGHSCAIVNGAVQCWGGNVSGQIGNHPLQSYSLSPTVAITTGNKVSTVVAGDKTCATVDGGVQCWGLATGSSPVVQMAAGSGVTGTTAGQNCMVFDGRLQCGNLVEITSGASAVAQSIANTCGVADGGVQCWNSSLPAVVITAGSKAISVSTGTGHACAVVNGGVQCWGSNSAGQLGNNSTTDSIPPVVSIAAGSKVTAVAAGYQHSCAVINGGVQCWGDNSSGQLGNNSTTARLTPVVALAAGSNATSVSVGRNHTCAVVNGGVQCWGNNDRGQLGNDSTTSSLVPVIAIAAGSNVTLVSAGNNIENWPCPSGNSLQCDLTQVSHTCAVVNGGVVCWGDSKVGKLGNPAIHQLGNYLSGIVFASLPSAPTITSATVGAGTAILVFSPPLNNGGAAITNYIATCSTVQNYPPVSVIAAASVTSIAVSGLRGGITYNCVVAASNGTGPGSLSNATSVAPTIAPPSAPMIAGVLSGAGSAKIIFSPPANNGGNPVNGYTGICKATGYPNTSASSGSSPLIVDGLVGGVLYVCSITAKNIAGASPPSDWVSVVPDASLLPGISFIVPTDNSIIPAGSIVPMELFAQSGGGTIAKLEVFDGNVLIKTLGPYLSTAIDTGFSVDSFTLGSHVLTAKVTNTLGSTAISSSVTLLALAPPKVVLNTTGNFYLAPGGITLFAKASPAAGSGASIAKVEFYNGAVLLGTLTSAPYHYRWNNVAAGSYSVRAKVTDSLGGAMMSDYVSLTVGTTISLAPVPGLDGSTVNDDRISLSGTIQVPANSALTVNGYVGNISPDGNFFINNLPLQPGSNTLTLTVTTIDGQSLSQVVTVNSTGVAPFTFSVDHDKGYAPQASHFTIVNRGHVAFKRIELSCTDNGTADFTVLTEALLSDAICGYATPGIYRARIKVIAQPDGQAEQEIYNASQSIYVTDVRAMDRVLRGVFTDMLERLKSGDISLTLNVIGPEVRDRFSAIFNSIGTDLPTVVDQLGVMGKGNLNDEFAEYVVIRNGPQGPEAYMIQMTPGHDGIWRIEGM